MMQPPDPAEQRRMEAAEWIRRVRAEGHTRSSGRRRMSGILDDIEARRGHEARQALEAEIWRQLSEPRA